MTSSRHTPVTKNIANSSRLLAEMLKMDASYNAFDESVRAVLREIEIVMLKKKIQQIGLGQGVPKGSRGSSNKIVLIKAVLKEGRLALLDRAGEYHRLDALEPDTLHYLASRIRGSFVFAKLIE